jgi:hypothetical protein
MVHIVQTKTLFIYKQTRIQAQNRIENHPKLCAHGKFIWYWNIYDFKINLCCMLLNRGIQQSIEEKSCWINKGIKNKWKHMRVICVYCLPTILQQLLSSNNYHLVEATFIQQLPYAIATFLQKLSSCNNYHHAHIVICRLKTKHPTAYKPLINCCQPSTTPTNPLCLMPTIYVYIAYRPFMVVAYHL